MKILTAFFIIIFPFLSFTQVPARSIEKYSLYLKLYDKAGKYITNGTGFVIDYRNKKYLISNYHIFTGKNPLTKEQLFTEPHSCTILAPGIKQGVSLFLQKGNEMYYMPIPANRTQMLDVAFWPFYNTQVNADQLPSISTSAILRTNNVSLGTSIVIAGYPIGKTDKTGAKSYFGKTKPSYDPRFLIYDAKVEGGTSGAPIFSLNGTSAFLIGINSKGIYEDNLGFFLVDLLAGIDKYERLLYKR